MKKIEKIFKEKKVSRQIVQEIFDFGVNDKVINLTKGDLVALQANVPHDLFAVKESIVRLTLSKQDSVDRVKKVIE